MTTLSICICTYKRAHLLDALCHAIDAQLKDKLHTEIIVVDNDPAHSARAVLLSLQSVLTTPLTFLHVPVANIAAARNAAVQQAQGEWLLCIDDDELPDPHWIDAMLAAQKKYQADVVFGPVVPRYLPDMPAWMIKGKFFERPRYPTGTVIEVKDARTGNVLLHRPSLMQFSPPFDLRFGRTGAEDTMLFRLLKQRQAVFIWCDEAVVSEIVPAQRATVTWMMKRSYRMGQTYILTEMAMYQGVKQWQRKVYLFCRSLLQLGIAAGLSVCFCFNRIKAMRWLRITSAQCGKISALCGHRYFEYGN